MSIENKDQRPGSQAVTLREALTGASLDSPSYPYRPDQTFSLYDANKRIKEALKTGDEAIVSLIVRSMVPRFTEALSFPLAEYHKGSERISRLLVTLGHLDALFDDSAVSHLHNEFFAYAEASLAFYRDQTRAQLSQDTRAFVVAESGNVGLDALHGVDRLTRLMICDGTPVPASEAKLGRDIYVIERIEEAPSHAADLVHAAYECEKQFEEAEAYRKHCVDIADTYQFIEAGLWAGWRKDCAEENRDC